MTTREILAWLDSMCDARLVVPNETARQAAAEIRRLEEALARIVKCRRDVEAQYKRDPGAMLAAELAGWRAASDIAQKALTNHKDQAP